MIILRVTQENIPKTKKEIVTFEVDEDFLSSQLSEQGYTLIKKSEENNPINPEELKRGIIRKIIMDYTGQGHCGGGFTDELREETVERILDLTKE